MANGPAGLLAPGSVPPIDGDLRPTLLVVVDTEEEFDWKSPHDRANTSVTAMREIERIQRVFDGAGVRPCYVVDYPVASQPEGSGPLAEILSRGGCEIGAHLHPWVNPPYDEPVNVYNSFPGNLAEPLERDKLERLGAVIAAFTGAAPLVYKAGRYGIGPNTASILEQLGYRVDLSPTPAFSYARSGGPDFGRFPNHPFWFGSDGDLLCIPCTGEVVGLLGRAGRHAHGVATSRLGGRLRAGGVLARLRLAERIRLSPEGFTLDEMIRLTRYLLAQGVRVLTLSLHSPSVQPGCTPYVRDTRELQAFIERIEEYLAFFLGELGGTASTPLEVYEALAPARGADASRCATAS